MATDAPPAAIVTRIWQRGPTDGIELTRRVRAHPATRDFLLLPATPELVAYQVERAIADRAARVKRSTRAVGCNRLTRTIQRRSACSVPIADSCRPLHWLSNEDAIHLLNAWRRLTAFVALVDRPGAPSDSIALIRDFVEPAMAALNRLIDQMPPGQLAAAIKRRPRGIRTCRRSDGGRGDETGARHR